MRNFILTVLTGPSQGDKFTFDLTPQGVVIGRSPDCELVLQDPLVSRRHAKIYASGNEMLLADLGSTHGTVHMGFRLEAGEENARRVLPEDEFKVGDSLFRIAFEEQKAAAPDRSAAPDSGNQPAVKRKIPLIALGLVALLGLLFLLTGEPESTMPPQRSGEKITLPEKTSFGFLPEGDRSHADKVIVEIPPSDGVLEYDFNSTGSTSIQLDGIKIDSLPPTEGGWEQRLLLLRDPVGGRERVLVFDEEKNSPETIAQQRPLTRWGVRNLRFTPIPYRDDRSADDAIQGALALSELLGRSNSSLYQLAKGLQKAGLMFLRESRFDAQPVPINRDSPRPDPELIKLKLEGVLQERRGEIAPDTLVRHSKVITDLIGTCEAELWRKFTVDLRQAINDSKSKDYIQAHDRLLAIQTMIGDDTDYRYRKASELLDDKKVIPPKVRKNPGKYRKEL